MSMKKFGKDIETHIMTGISYMIPLVIAGAVLMAISRVGASFYGISDIWDTKWATNANWFIQFLHTDDGWDGLSSFWKMNMRQQELNRITCNQA